MWPLSSFGPAKHQPNLVGPLDDSPEELRVKAAQAAKAGTTQDYVSTLTLAPFLHLGLFHAINCIGRILSFQTLRDTQLYACLVETRVRQDGRSPSSIYQCKV